MQKFESICQNKWCKAKFYYTENDMIISNTNSKFTDTEDIKKEAPKECPKCKSFNNELSGGVTWTEKKYEGNRIDGLAHPVSINVSKYTDKRRW